MIRQRLEELSFEVLLEVAVRNEVDVDLDIDRADLVDTLVEAITENRRERDAQTNAPGKVVQTKFSMGVDDGRLIGRYSGDDLAIPEQYSVTRIALMLRDPLWAYTYWDLSSDKRSEYERSDRFDGLSLRVLQLEDDGDEELQISESFEIPVSLTDASWYIHLPVQNASYRIQLVGKNYHRRELLAVSNRVRSPRTALAVNGDSISDQDRRLLELCGLEFLDVNVAFETYVSRMPKR